MEETEATVTPATLVDFQNSCFLSIFYSANISLRSKIISFHRRWSTPSKNFDANFFFQFSNFFQYFFQLQVAWCRFFAPAKLFWLVKQFSPMCFFLFFSESDHYHFARNNITTAAQPVKKIRLKFFFYNFTSFQDAGLEVGLGRYVTDCPSGLAQVLGHQFKCKFSFLIFIHWLS